ncbi:hypothetical protein [Brachybacterium hainanense]|uniref:Uncharacterized protein n=1 Tax=Brachybacterium hainanense TaxID=1541174 RepID=A0ABV6RF96_9MICO
MPDLDGPSEALQEIHPHIELETIRFCELYCTRKDVKDPDDLPQFML